MKILNGFFVLLLYAFRPLNHFILGPSCCKFAISCTEYAIEQFKKKSFALAIISVCKRLISCSPLSLFFKMTPH